MHVTRSGNSKASEVGRTNENSCDSSLGVSKDKVLGVDPTNDAPCQAVGVLILMFDPNSRLMMEAGTQSVSSALIVNLEEVADSKNKWMPSTQSPSSPLSDEVSAGSRGGGGETDTESTESCASPLSSTKISPSHTIHSGKLGGPFSQNVNRPCSLTGSRTNSYITSPS